MPSGAEHLEEPTTFDGEFTPPALGNTDQPLPVAGSGTFRFEESSIAVEGAELRSGRGCLFVALFFAGFALVIVGGVVASATLGFEPGSNTGETVVGVVVLGICMKLAPRLLPDAAKEGTTAEYTVPYDRIRGVEMVHGMAPGAPEDAVVVKIEEYEPEGIDGEREIYFRPEGDSHDFIHRLERRIGAGPET